MDLVLEKGADAGDTEALKRNPEKLVELTITEKFSFDADTLNDIQLGAAKMRFKELVDKVPALRRMAEDQGVSEITSFDDIAKLLFPHTLYKSYPLSVLEQGRFDRLTKWLDSLTAYDLSGLDASHCDNIDDWLDFIDANSDVRIRHSSGTTGKLSFVPQPVAEYRTTAYGWMRYFEGFGNEPDAGAAHDVGQLPLINFSHRWGASSSARTLNALRDTFYGGDDSKFIISNSGRMSADMLSLGGRLAGAEAKGELGKMTLSPTLLARREVFKKEQEEAPKRLTRFFEQLEEVRGQKVIFAGVVPIVVDAVVEGLKRGMEKMFAPDSLLMMVGGAKGRTLPDNYEGLVEQFTNGKYPRPGYGMSEAASTLTRLCPKGHYHLNPNSVPFLLHPETGDILPRKGVQTGRFGLFDIACQHRWGGFLTSDEITLNWGDEAPCSCGRKGAFIQGEIRRYAGPGGADDKINCAGAPGVHDKAVEFLSGGLD